MDGPPPVGRPRRAVRRMVGGGDGDAAVPAATPGPAGRIAGPRVRGELGCDPLVMADPAPGGSWAVASPASTDDRDGVAAVGDPDGMRAPLRPRRARPEGHRLPRRCAGGRLGDG